MSTSQQSSGVDEIRRMLKHALVYGGGIVVSKAVGFIMVPLYTRLLTPADYGLLELLTRGAEVAAIVLTLGFSTSVLRFYYDVKSEQDRNAVASSALVFSALVALAATVPLAAFAERLSLIFLGTPDHRVFVLLLVYANLFELTSVVPMALLRAREESALYTAVSIARLVLGLGLNIALVAVLRMGVLGVLVSGLVSGALTAIWLVALSVRRTGLAFSPAKIKPMLLYGLPLVPATLGMFILHSADRFFLSAYAGLDQVGLYALAYRFAMLLPVLVLQPWGLAFMPTVFSVSERPEATLVYSRALTFLTVIATWFALGMSILTKDALRILATPAYLDAARPLPLIVFSFVFLGMQGIFEIGIHLRKVTVFRLVNVASAAAVALLLCRVLIPPYGMMGAAWATFGSFACLAALSYLVSQRLYPVRYDWPRLAHAFVAAGALYALAALFAQGSGVGPVGVRVLLALSFPVLLAATGFLTNEEKKILDRIRVRRRRTPTAPQREAAPPALGACPPVSVIIATYNYGHLIARSVDSLLSQDYPALEVIVADDGSTDNTEAVLESYRDRLRYVRCEHRGVASARNSGLEVAHGEYIGFLDADDMLLPGSIQRRVAFLESQPDIDVVFGDVEVVRGERVVVPSFLAARKVFRRLTRRQVGEREYVLPGSLFAPLVRERFITVPSVLVRCGLLDRVGGFDAAFNDSQDDYDLWLRMAATARFGYVDRLLARCLIHGSNISANKSRAAEKRIELMHKLLTTYPDLEWRTRRLIAQRLSEQHFQLGYLSFSDGLLGPAREHLSSSLRYRPLPNRAAFYLLCSMLHPAAIETLRRGKRRVIAGIRGQR